MAISLLSQERGNNRCLVGMLYTAAPERHVCFSGMVLHIVSAWVSMLLVLLSTAMPHAGRAGRATIRLLRFLFVSSEKGVFRLQRTITICIPAKPSEKRAIPLLYFHRHGAVTNNIMRHETPAYDYCRHSYRRPSSASY